VRGRSGSGAGGSGVGDAGGDVGVDAGTGVLGDVGGVEDPGGALAWPEAAGTADEPEADPVGACVAAGT
jgi:hypothetical protein